MCVSMSDGGTVVLVWLPQPSTRVHTFGYLFISCIDIDYNLYVYYNAMQLSYLEMHVDLASRTCIFKSCIGAN